MEIRASGPNFHLIFPRSFDFIRFVWVWVIFVCWFVFVAAFIFCVDGGLCLVCFFVGCFFLLTRAFFGLGFVWFSATFNSEDTDNKNDSFEGNIGKRNPELQIP